MLNTIRKAPINVLDLIQPSAIDSLFTRYCRVKRISTRFQPFSAERDSMIFKDADKRHKEHHSLTNFHWSKPVQVRPIYANTSPANNFPGISIPTGGFYGGDKPTSELVAILTCKIFIKVGTNSPPNTLQQRLKILVSTLVAN